MADKIKQEERKHTMAKTLHVRITDKARIWTTLPQGTIGACELDENQSKRLRQKVSNLKRRNAAKFTKHADALKKGSTVKAQANGEVAAAILAVL